MIKLYSILTSISAPILNAILNMRVKSGKEDPLRLYERKGQSSTPRPDGTLIWFHAASVGEAQSTLILINKVIEHKPDCHILVTTGTRTSAQLMAQRLPENAIHQYYPLDHPKWCQSFIKHWKPNGVVWMESELWPNMLKNIRSNSVPAILVNARLSDKSYKNWRRFPKAMHTLLSTFDVILTQSETDTERFQHFKHEHVFTTDNIKYAAEPLPFNDDDLKNLEQSISNRPIWVYASTHAGEEELAKRIHANLKKKHPDLLTIIVPRHPERRDDIAQALVNSDHSITFRGTNKTLPIPDTDIYIADTLGELGLFYTISNIAMIGRSFSNDGGGGHNPIEAAQTHCAILTGPNHQFQQGFFDALKAQNAVIIAESEQDLTQTLDDILSDNDKRNALSDNAYAFCQQKINVIDRIFTYIKENFAL